MTAEVLGVPAGEPIAPLAPLAVVDAAGRLALATTSICGLVEHHDYFVELRPCPAAFERVPLGLVPVLIEHYSTHWNVEHQLGLVRETRATADGRSVELLLQFGHNPRAEWIWRDLCDGLPFGCSIGFRMFGRTRALPPAPLRKPLYTVPEWVLLEVTILAAAGGQDDRAKVIRPQNVAELLAEMRALREAREEVKGRALPEYYAEPLRRRLPAIAAALAHVDAGAAETAIAAVLEREISAYIAAALA